MASLDVNGDLGEARPRVLSSASSISVMVKCARDKEKQRPEASSAPWEWPSSSYGRELMCVIRETRTDKPAQLSQTGAGCLGPRPHSYLGESGRKLPSGVRRDPYQPPVR